MSEELCVHFDGTTINNFWRNVKDEFDITLHSNVHGDILLASVNKNHNFLASLRAIILKYQIDALIRTDVFIKNANSTHCYLLQLKKKLLDEKTHDPMMSAFGDSNSIEDFYYKVEEKIISGDTQNLLRNLFYFVLMNGNPKNNKNTSDYFYWMYDSLRQIIGYSNSETTDCVYGACIKNSILSALHLHTLENEIHHGDINESINAISFFGCGSGNSKGFPGLYWPTISCRYNHLGWTDIPSECLCLDKPISDFQWKNLKRSITYLGETQEHIDKNCLSK